MKKADKTLLVAIWAWTLAFMMLIVFIKAKVLFNF